MEHNRRKGDKDLIVLNRDPRTFIHEFVDIVMTLTILYLFGYGLFALFSDFFLHF